MNRTLLALLVLLSISACLDVADDRADRDATVGQRSAEGVRVSVQDGLARVRSLSPSAVELWAQAPQLAFTVERDTAGDLEILGRNVLADAVLSVRGAGLEVELVESRIATEKRWRIAGAPAGELELALEVADGADRSPWRAAIYADVQDHIDVVQDIYERMAEDPSIRFALISGDLTEQGTPKELRRFQREMETLPFPCYATLGNHELGDGDFNFHDFFGRGNFSFEFRGVRFTLLDSASATLAPRVLDWLEEWLDAGADKLHLAMMHIPLRDPSGQRNGAFASRAEANKILGMFARHGVDLTFYGHVHSFYTFENAGIPAYIVGGGGAIEERMDGIGRHYAVVDFEPAAGRATTGVVRVD